MGDAEYFVRKDNNGKYMYNINNGNDIIYEAENQDSIPNEVINYLTQLHNKKINVNRLGNKLIPRKNK